MPPLTVALDLPLLGERRKHTVKVIGRDLHFFCQLGNGDPRPAANQLECLRGTGATATAPPSARSPRAAPSAPRTPWSARSATDERGPCCLQPGEFLSQLFEPLVDVFDGHVNEFRHDLLLYSTVNVVGNDTAIQ